MRNNRILYLQYTNPAAYPPLQHSSRILADAGWDVLFLGTRAVGSDALEFPKHEHIRILRMPFCAPGMRHKLHFLRYVLWSWWWALRWRPQWIYASDPLSTPAALLAGVLPGMHLLYHEHDSPSGKPGSAFMRWVLAFRKRLAKIADVVVLPNTQRAVVFSRETGIDPIKVQCVWNCPAREDASFAPKDKQDGVLWVHYHGNISPQLVPLAVIDALALLPDDIKLRVIGYETMGTAGYLTQLRERARAVGVDARIELHGAMPREAMLTWARKSDVGIALFPKSAENQNMQLIVGASNKPFDYLACGCPLLVSDLPDWNAMFVQNGLALNCNPEDPESIAAAIRWYCAHPIERLAMGEAGRQRIRSEWNYEAQFKPMLLELLAGRS